MALGSACSVRPALRGHLVALTDPGWPREAGLWAGAVGSSGESSECPPDPGPGRDRPGGGARAVEARSLKGVSPDGRDSGPGGSPFPSRQTR